jgi:hypothetical protein
VTACGFRIKSGHAIAVVLGGSRRTPEPIARRIVDLSDPDRPETRQPYHDGFGKEQDDPQEIKRRIAIITRCAERSMAEFVRDSIDAAGGEPRSDRHRAAGLVVGSLIDPKMVANPHIRAHAYEGRLFRTVVEDALRANGITCSIHLEKDLTAIAAAELRRAESAIRQTAASFGKTIGGPWRADEKAAAIAAWMCLM